MEHAKAMSLVAVMVGLGAPACSSDNEDTTASAGANGGSSATGGAPGVGGNTSMSVGGGGAGAAGSGGGPNPDACRANLPAGWATISDYGFDDTLPPHQDGQFWEVPLGSSGWSALDWGGVGGEIKRSVDATAPCSPEFVLEEVYPPHLSGTGPSKVFYNFSAADELYVSWAVMWQTGFDHNTTSEKLIFFNLGDADGFLFQFLYGVEMVYGIDEDGFEALRANQLPPNEFGHGDAPPVDGTWQLYELYFDRATGTVRWWKDGILHGSHTGRTFPAIHNVEIDATWGGGGDKMGTHSRYTDHIFIAGQ